MGGVIGATSSKFILASASLLLQGRVNGELTTLAVMPSARSSAISTARLEKLVHHKNARQPYRIGIRREYFRGFIAINERVPVQGAEVRIGRDLLDSNPLLVDFSGHHLRLLGDNELRRISRTWLPLHLGNGPLGTTIISVAQAGTQGTTVSFDFAHESAQPEMPVGSYCIAQRAGGAVKRADAIVGMEIFSKLKVVFDFAHATLWTPRRGRFAPALGPLD